MTPLLLGEHLEEGIETLVHPAPLTFVRVDDHWEPVVANFVDDHRDEAVFGALRISPVFFGTRSVKADHGILHSVNGTVDRDGHRVGVVEGELGIEVQSVNDRVGGIGAPERLGFIGVK